MSRFSRYTGSSTLGQFVQSREAADQQPSKTEYVLIDSRDRDIDVYPDPGEYMVQLPETLRQVSKLSLISAEVPSSFFVFSASRNNTSLTVTFHEQTSTITIVDGNYGFTAMCNALRDALNTAFRIVGAYEPFDVRVDPVTFFVNISGPILAPGGMRENFQITLASGDREWPLSYYLGLGRGDTVLSSSQGVLVGTGVCSLNPEVYICLDIVGVNQILEAGIEGEGGTMGHTSAIIPLNVDSFQYVFFDRPVVPNYIQPPIGSLQSLHVKFRFHDGTPIYFNGVNHALTFEIECSRVR